MGVADVGSAAALTGSVSTPAAGNVNLTAKGTTDWAIWDYQSSSTGTSGAPSNRRLGGSAIGNMSAALGTPRGITGTVPVQNYTYTDGTSPTSATGSVIGAITDTSINVVGSGVKLNITGDPTTPETVTVYVTGFNAIGTFTAQLNGATTYTDSTPSFGATRTPAVYTLTFQPNLVTDTLQLSYTISTLNAGGNANLDLQAVTVAAVPEPCALGLLAAGGLQLLRRRR